MQDASLPTTVLYDGSCPICSREISQYQKSDVHAQICWTDVSSVHFVAPQGYERQQIAPRHNEVHFIEQDLLARAPGAEIESEVGLFHAFTARNLRASIEVIGMGF